MNIETVVLDKDVGDISSILGLRKQRAGQIIHEAIKKGIKPEAVRRGPNGRFYYSAYYVDQVAAYYKAKTRSRHLPQLRAVEPELSLQVPLYSPKIRSILMLRFGSVDGVMQFLKKTLDHEIRQELTEDLGLLA